MLSTKNNHTTSKKRKLAAVSSNAAKKKASVTTEEQDEENMMNDGITEVKKLDSDGNTVKTYPLQCSHSVTTSDAEDIAEEVEEDDKAKLKHMKECWTLHMYVFFDPVLAITYVKD
ncbi:hypothetical protein EWM64_g5110 [Hericium alpestre]|uniref:Uncharacterized protein n=1 Tax=Hericium alpestre TaxID=135208 RepID=A0A4Y9ZZG0_9AGAM|nr:hypothetical protein EWM64_g5110 [Hericium alpestre]